MQEQSRRKIDKYALCNKTAYCLDANYAKGISFEQFLKKHRRQLIIEVVLNNYNNGDKKNGQNSL